MAEAASAPSLEFFQAAGLRLAAKRWGIPGGRPMLALHGWLDNCASFDFLAPLLEGCEVVCVDAAGHGKSDHRHHLGAYNIWQDIAELFAVADQLGWREFDLLGHSRGAMVAFLAAGTFPSRIKRLLMIEGACPRLGDACETAEALAESIRFLSVCLHRPKSIYPSFASAVAARERGLFPLTHIDALALGEHGIVAVEGGFSWHYDPKVMAGSELKLSAEQVDSFYRRIRAQALLVMGTEGILHKDARMQQWLQGKSEWSVVKLAGQHHLHMSEQCRQVAEAIGAFAAEFTNNRES